MAWFTFTTFARLTLARAEKVTEVFTAIQTALANYLGTDGSLYRDKRPFYGTDTGAVNAYVVTLDPVPSGYVNGLTIDLNAANSNTGASTINVNGLGAKSILDGNGAALTAGQIVAGRTTQMKYDGTQFRLNSTPVTTTPADGSVTTAKLATLTNIPMATGGTINWNTGNYVITHSAGTLSFNGGASGIISLTDGTLVYRVGAIAGGPTVLLGTTTNHTVTMIANNTTIQSWTGTGTTIVTGALTLTPGQIAFPGTQNPSAGANTFDDYEEGTFTPSASATSGTITTMGTQTGWYRKIAGMLNGCFDCTCTTNGTGASTLNVAGLPFTSTAASSVIGRELVVSGKVVGGNLSSGSTTATGVTFYDNTYPFANTSRIVVNLAYPVA